MFEKIAVLGAGNGGYAMAADLSMAGYYVNLYEDPDCIENIDAVNKRGGIEVVARSYTGEEIILPAGGKTGFAKVKGKVTANIKEALDGVDLIMLIVPGFVREKFVRKMAPLLEDGQTIVIWPAYFGALQCSNLLEKIGIKKDIIICETESILYASRKSGTATISVMGTKNKLLLSAFPSKNTKKVMKDLQNIYPQLVEAKNVFETTFSNVNPPLHPQCVLLNLYRVERKFYPYYEILNGPFCSAYDVTPGMARVMEKVDKEKLGLVKKYGLNILSLQESLNMFYGAYGNNLYEVISNCYAYKNMIAPMSINSRYVTEDLQFAFVPFVYLADQVSEDLPVIRGMVEIGKAATGINFWEDGLQLEDLGLHEKSISEINKYLSS